MDRTDLQHLSKDELIDLVLQLQRPDKTSRTSSKPPSTDKKEKRENARPGGAKLGHEPHNRRLADNPDEFRDHIPTHCDLCGGSLSSDAELELIGEYDEIEIPPVKPYVVRHRRFACQCQHCDPDVKAPAPAVATATPFGPRIHALAIFYKGFQALSYECLRGMFRDAFGLSVSEGALMNMFIRSHAGFKIEADKARAPFAKAGVVASDETGVRIEGILRLIEEPGEISCVFQFGGFCCAHDSSWWLPQRRRSQQADRVGARWVGGLSRDAPRQRLGAFA